MRELGLATRWRGSRRTLVHFTGYERPVGNHPRLHDTLLRRVGQMLGTADIIAQMSDRCYLEKCRDRLYPEFVLGGLAGASCRRRKLLVFASGEDLVQQDARLLPGRAAKRLDLQLARAYEYAARHFGGPNLYLEEMQQERRATRRRGGATRPQRLRRQPPSTLAPEVKPYPKDLMKL